MSTVTSARTIGVLFGVALAGALSMAAAAPPYDPLAIANPRKAEPFDCTVRDTKRSRDIPLRVYLPADKRPAPVVLFSHGLGGSREGSPYLGEHWSARGFVVVVVQHIGSDDAVWKDIRPAERLAAMQKAASLQNTLLRFGDIPAVIDQLDRWHRSSDSPLAGRLDMKRIGMSGHSFGAVTTQGVSGQRTALGAASFADPRIKAALAMSPSSPRNGDPKRAFSGVAIPWLLMTGTNDVAIVGDADVASRLAVFPALPPGGKYELVLNGAEHSAFSDRALPGDKEKRNPNHHRAILALSTAFWDAWLRDDAEARVWLDGAGPSSVLEKQDRWQRK
jgi:predicted dienelactone hydrolase